MKRNFCKQISMILMAAMLAFCMAAVLVACQSKKELSLNNYEKYIRAEWDARFDSENGHIVIIDLIVIKKVNKDDNLFDIKIKCSYKINDYEGEFSEYLGDLNSAYTKEIRLPEEIVSHSGQVTVLEISGTAQESAATIGNRAAIIFGIVIIVSAFGILILFVASGLKFSANFDKIQIGMSYNNVIEILGEPYSNSNAGNISTCVWRKRVLRGWTMVRAVTFKEGAVISKTL